MIRRQLLSSKLFSGRRTLHVITSSTAYNKSDISETIQEHPHTKKCDDDQQHNYIEITNAQRLILSVGSSIAALVNPRR